MQNSMVIFTFSVFDWKSTFWANLVQKIKIVCLSWNLVPTLIRAFRIQWWYSLFLLLIGNPLFGQIWSKKLKLSVQGKTLYLNWFKYAEFNSDVHFFRFGRKYSDWDNFFQSIKIISWSWNLVPILIRICKIQWWYSLFLFMIRRTLFGQIWSKKLKLPVQGETLDLN